MKVAIIGRSEVLYEVARVLVMRGHEIKCVLTATEAPEYTKTSSDFSDLASQLNVPFGNSGRVLMYRDMLALSDADIGVSMNYPSILPQSVIDLFPLGILNIHPGDLPRYRGNACQAWALLQGESRLAVCVHRMIGGEIDSGDIISRSYLDVDFRTKVGQAWRWLVEIAPVLVLDALEKLQHNPNFAIERQSGRPSDALRCYPRKPEDGRIFWDRPAIEVLRLINASGRPYAGAFCQLEAERMVVWEAELGNMQERFLAVPGQTTRIGVDHVEVACREGMVRLTEVELKGEVAPPSRFIRSLRTRLA
jgi:methionyl-tRNA formyltransferase